MSYAWSKSATVENSGSGFRSCRIIPLNMSAILEYAFLTTQKTSTVDLGQENVEVSPNPKSSNDVDILDKMDIPMDANIIPMPSTSQGMGRPTAQPTQREIDESKTLTPSKILAMMSPIPNVTKKVTDKCKAASVGKMFNSLESIQTIVTIKENKEQLLKEK